MKKILGARAGQKQTGSAMLVGSNIKSLIMRFKQFKVIENEVAAA